MRPRRLSLAGSITLAAALLAVGCTSARTPVPAVPPPPPSPAAVGSWLLTVDTPQGTQQPTLTISGTAESLAGVLSGELGDLELTDVTFSTGVLTFKTSLDFQGQVLDLDFEGTVDGDSLAGRFDTPFGQIPANGIRQTP